MLVAMCINLYASRLLLEMLGVNDYGTYNIIGGIITLLMFVNSAMQTSTTRFITYSLGKDEISDIKETVNAAFHNHLYILVLIVIVSETIGLWFVNNQLNIPEGSMYAANWVYQFTIISSCCTIIQNPFTALVISYERMNVYAYLEILNVLGRFLIIFLLPCFATRLIGYSMLIAAVSVVILFLYYIYCKRNISSFVLSINVNKKTSKPMLNFALWSLFGNGTYALSRQGTNILINKFFGVAANAASGVATQASSVISTFTASIQSAFNPQVIKEYSMGNSERMRDLIYKETDIIFFLTALLFTPLYINMDYILLLWLKNVPVYSVAFCRILLICNLIQIATNIFSVAIQATGHNRLFSFIIGIINILCVVLVIIFFMFGGDAPYAYIAILLSFSIKLLVEILLVNLYIPQLKIKNIVIKLLKSVFLMIISFYITLIICEFFKNQNQKLFICILVNCLVLATLFLTLYSEYRRKVTSFYFRLIKK